MEIKKPFNINLRAEIESGKCRVETNDNRPVRIICWDRVDETLNEPIVALVRDSATREFTSTFRKDGYNGAQFYLVIVYEVPDISEFEGLLYEALLDANDMASDVKLQIAKNYAPILLKAARLRIEGEEQKV